MPAQSGMIENAGHHVAVDRVENEDDIEDEQRDVALAGVFDDQQRHQAADDDVLHVVGAVALLPERHVIRVHVVGAVQREQAVDECDHVVHANRQLRIELVLTQRLQREQNVDDRDQGHGQHHGPAGAGPVVVEQVQAERDGRDVIDHVERERRPVLRLGVGHGEPMRLSEFKRGGRNGAPASD